MTTFSFLSHSKRLPRATGTDNFDIEKCRAAPSRQRALRERPLPEWYTGPGTLLAAGLGLRERHASRQAAASHMGYPSVATSESVPAAITLLPRALWTIHKGTSIGVLMVLAHLIQRGEYQEVHEIIKRQ